MRGHLPSGILQLAELVAERCKVEVYHLSMPGRTLRIEIDAPGGATMQTCSQFSRELSAELDARDTIHTQYVLEVASPGIERNLYEPGHFSAQLGNRVKIRTKTDSCIGTLISADVNGIAIQCESDEPRSERRVCYADIESARLKVAKAELFSKATAAK